MHFTRACILSLLLSSLWGVTHGLLHEEPAGRLLLKSVFVKDFLQPMDGVKSVNMTLTCSTQTRAGRVRFPYPIKETDEGFLFAEGFDLHLELLSHESADCELTEETGDEESENSHGRCEFTYARFLAPESNTVTCRLVDGSSFALRMDCKGLCPDPVPPPEKPYCKKSKRLLPVDIGKSHTFSDGSPGFAMYAPNSTCSWTLPRSRKGVTNFLFSRMDLGTGDFIKVYGSPGGKKRKRLIKTYDEYSIPESVSTADELMIIEFTADAMDEGLGFWGFYYYSENATETVAIAGGKGKKQDYEATGVLGRKFV